MARIGVFIQVGAVNRTRTVTGSGYRYYALRFTFCRRLHKWLAIDTDVEKLFKQTLCRCATQIPSLKFASIKDFDKFTVGDTYTRMRDNNASGTLEFIDYPNLTFEVSNSSGTWNTDGTHCCRTMKFQDPNRSLDPSGVTFPRFDLRLIRWQP